MKEVGLRELKNRLSEYVRQVRAGEGFLVTDRGIVVAELRPPGSPPGPPDTPPGLYALARRGAATLGTPNEAALYPRLPRSLPAGTAQRLLDFERGER
jgi:antitoxin (DNA-binding transcriptional repressor) of toxin-antitoxin stability system